MLTTEIKICDSLDRGLSYGEAVFETFCIVGGAVFCLPLHKKRLQKGLALYGLDVSHGVLDSWFEQAITSVSEQHDSLLRITVSGGDADWGLLPPHQQNPSVYVQHLAIQSHRAALHLKSCEWPFPLHDKQAKLSSDYAEILRAYQRVKNNLNAEMQPLFCSVDGMILSSLTANIALYRQGEWLAPMGMGILTGVVRGYLLNQGIMRQMHCPQAWLDDCEAIVCLNSGVFVQPVASINGRGLDVQHLAYQPLKQAFKGEPGVPVNLCSGEQL